MAATETVAPDAATEEGRPAHFSANLHVDADTATTAEVFDGAAVVRVPLDRFSIDIIGRTPDDLLAWLDRARDELAEAISAHVRAGMDE